MVRVLALLAACTFSLACGPKVSEETAVPGDAGACLNAQFMEEEGAAGICRSECADGIGESCAVLAMMLERGHLVEPSHAEAAFFAFTRSHACRAASDRRHDDREQHGVSAMHDGVDHGNRPRSGTYLTPTRS